MSELPFDKPDQDLTWDNGVQTEPSAGRRLSGWESGGDRPAGEFNWRYDAMKKHIDWIDEEIYLPRIFTDGVEILDTIPAGSTVRLQAPQDWGDGDVTKTTPGTVTHLVTDSRRVYYVVGTTLYAATADAVTTEQNEWSADLAADGLASVDFISTDGMIVSVWGSSSTSGKILLAYLISDDGLSLSTVDSIAVVGDVVGIRADSISTTQRVWIGIDNTSTIAGDLFIWTPAGGLVLAVSAGAGLDSMAMSNDHILMRLGTALNYVRKSDYSVNPLVVLVGGAVAALANEDTFFLLRASALSVYRFGAQSGLNPQFGLGRIRLNAGTDTSFAVGGRVIITNRGAYSLQSCELLHLFEVPSTGPIAIAGQYVWVVISGDLVARPLGLRGGEVWERRSDGSDEAIGRSDATTRLLILQDRGTTNNTEVV